jgi:hypothetical protein
MIYNIIKPEQRIELIANRNATPTQALYESIEFCKNNKCEVDLQYEKFFFSIDEKSTLIGKLKDYNYYLENRNSLML